MYRTKVATFAALALAAAIAASSGEAQARPRFGLGFGIGLAAGALFAAGALAARPVYLEPGRCRLVERIDRHAIDVRIIKVCAFD